MALRVMQCLGDADLATAHHDAVAAQECVAVADDTGLVQLQTCTNAILATPCYELRGLPPVPDWAWWMQKDPTCPAIFAPPKGGPTGTGANGLGTCANPYAVQLPEGGTYPLVRDFGDLPDVPECIVGGQSEVVFRVRSNAAGEVNLNLSTPAFPAEIQVAVLEEDAPCGATAPFECVPIPARYATPIFRTSGGVHFRHVVVQLPAGTDWTTLDATAGFFYIPDNLP